ncbi:restriction endonuclease subunit S [filamentous cyanobacterium CCP1]|nr:restriction endonuclease subunit S [filamentous cyanobacterium CCP1]
MSFPKYQAYKDSGVEWLGEVPEHWDVTRLRFIFNIQKRIAGTEGFDVLSITQRGIKIKDIESGDGQLSSDYSKYQIVKKGDFAMNHMDLLTGYVDISPFEGVTSPDYRVFQAIDKGRDCPNFLLLLLQNGYHQKLFFPYGQGSAHLGRWRLPTEEFNNFVFPRPPYDEQCKISIFIGNETARIDALIAEQQQLIELLKEKRQAVICHAVTKGLDPTAPMKNSGVEWLGEVPAHWETSKLKFLCKVQTGDKDTENAVDDGSYPFFVRSQTIERINSFSHDCEAVLTAGDGAGVGKVFHYINEKFDFHQRVYMLNEFKKVLGKFVFHYLKENFYKVALTGEAKSTVDSLRMPMFLNFVFTVPSVNEQMQIIEFIEAQSFQYDKLIVDAINSISLLQERRSALISAAVTGKIDVRGWQALASASPAPILEAAYG